MAKADIWMPLYVADYLADTMHLTTAEHGAYLLLILHYWKSGPLVDDDSRLSTITRMGDAWSNASSTIKAFFEQRDGMLYHKRIDREKVAATSNKDRNHARAIAAAAKRWGKDASSNAPSNDQAILGDCPSPSPSINTSEAKASGGKPPKSPEPAEIIFSYGLSILTNAGTPEKQARSFLGGLRKAHEDDEIVKKLRECLIAKPLQPLEWLAAALPPRSTGNGRRVPPPENFSLIDYGQGGKL